MAGQTSWVIRDFTNVNQTSGSHPIFNGVAGDAAPGASLARSECPIRFPGVIKNLSVFLGLEQFAANYACHVNGGDTALSITTTGPTGQYENTTDEVAVADTDEITYRASVSSGSGTNRYSNAKYEFQPDGDRTISHMYAKNVSFAPTFQNNSQIERCNIIGLLAETSTTSDGRTEFVPREDGIWHGCYVYASPNTRGDDSEVHNRINDVKQNILVTVTAGMTGVFEDSSSSDAFVAGDRLNWGAQNFTGGGNWRAEQISSMISRALPCWEMTPWNPPGGSQNSGLTYDNPPGGGWRGISSGNGFWEVIARTNQAFQFFQTNVSANSLSVDAEQWMRVARSAPGDSPSLVTIAAGMTGQFESNSQHLCRVGEEVTLRRRSSGGGGAWTMIKFQCLESPEIAKTTEIFWAMPVMHVVGGGH